MKRRVSAGDDHVDDPVEASDGPLAVKPSSSEVADALQSGKDVDGDGGNAVGSSGGGVGGRGIHGGDDDGKYDEKDASKKDDADEDNIDYNDFSKRVSNITVESFGVEKSIDMGIDIHKDSGKDTGLETVQIDQQGM